MNIVLGLGKDRKHNMPNSPAFVAFPASLLFMALPVFLLLASFWNPGSLADAVCRAGITASVFSKQVSMHLLYISK